MRPPPSVKFLTSQWNIPLRTSHPRSLRSSSLCWTSKSRSSRNRWGRVKAVAVHLKTVACCAHASHVRSRECVCPRACPPTRVPAHAHAAHARVHTQRHTHTHMPPRQRQIEPREVEIGKMRQVGCVNCLCALAISYTHIVGCVLCPHTDRVRFAACA